MADELHLNPSYLGQILKRNQAEFFSIFESSAHAQKLLLYTDDTINEISEKVGFNNTNYFSKCLKIKWNYAKRISRAIPIKLRRCRIKERCSIFMNIFLFIIFPYLMKTVVLLWFVDSILIDNLKSRRLIVLDE